MAVQNDFANYLLDELQTLGLVTSKQMFGGYGLFMNGLMFAMVTDETLYLKSGPEIDSLFDELNLPSFNYLRQGKQISLSYRLAPDSILDDPQELYEWALRSYQVAMVAST